MGPEEPTMQDRGGRGGAAPPLTGERYRVGELLGRGGMGEVLLARDEQIGREVAIKRMRVSDPSERQIARFAREALVQGRLDHPAIVPVHELGRDVDGRPYFVMKRLTGVPLAQVIASAPRQRLLRAFADVCLAVEYAHTRGVIHRDLKPDNIMLGDFGEVYVIDWGVAKVSDDSFDPEGAASGEPLMTAAGAQIGTPGYMSPEQAKAQVVGPRADVYALGCILFEILAGQRLHPVGSAGLKSAIDGCDAAPSHRAPARDIAPELDAVCVAATAREASDRPGARELADRVQRYLDGDRDLAQRQALAREHLAVAHAAHDKGDRAIAMREAGRALALDPTLAAAASLVSRLMMEPPTETPPEVEKELATDATNAAAANARAALLAYAGYASFLPILLWYGRPLTALALGALIGIQAASTIRLARRRSGFPAVVFIALSTLMLALIAHLLSPMTIAPGMAAVTGLIVSLNPLRRIGFGRFPLALAMIAAVMVPWALERAGAIPATFAIDDDGMHVFAVAMRGGEVLTTLLGVVLITAMIAIAVNVGYRISAAAITAQRQLRVQAWQLRQLL